MLTFTQIILRFAPDDLIKNRLSIRQVMVRCLAYMRQEFFFSQTEICQPSDGIKTWISITSL